MNTNPPTSQFGGWPTLVVAGLSVSLILIDIFSMSLATSDVVSSLDLSATKAGLFVSAFSLPLAALPLVFGRVADYFGSRAVYLFGMFLYAAPSAFIIFSENIDLMLLARFIQGVGGAMVLPQTLVTAALSLGPQRRGYSIGMWGSISAMMLLAAPLFGGLLIENYGWKSIVLFNGAFSIILSLAFSVVVPRISRGKGFSISTFPATSSLILFFSLALTILSVGPAFEGRPSGLISLFIGMVLVFGWCYFEKDTGTSFNRLIGGPLLRNKSFVFPCVAAFVCNIVMFGGVVIVGLAISESLGSSQPSLTGYLYVPSLLAIVLFMPKAGALSQKKSRASRVALMTAVGVIFFSPVVIGLIVTQVESWIWLAFLPIFLQGISTTTIVSYASFTAISSVAPEQQGLASGAVAMSRNLGTTIGVSILTGLLAVSDSSMIPFLAISGLTVFAWPFLLSYLYHSRSALASGSV